jgi:hypothetical protein
LGINARESEVETLSGLLLEGRPVHTGVAIYTPSIGLDGSFEISVKVDARLLNAMNTKDAFSGTLTNAENIGKSSTDLAAMWNKEHADDPVG